MEIYKGPTGTRKMPLIKLFAVILLMLLMTIALVEADDENEGQLDDISEIDALAYLFFNMSAESLEEAIEEEIHESFIHNWIEETPLDEDSQADPVVHWENGLPQHPMEEDSLGNLVNNWNDEMLQVTTEDHPLADKVPSTNDAALQATPGDHPQADAVPSTDGGQLQATIAEAPQTDSVPSTNDGPLQATVDEKPQADSVPSTNDGTLQATIDEKPQTDSVPSINEGTPQSPSQEDSEADTKNEPEPEDQPEEQVKDSVSSFVRVTRFPENLTQDSVVEVEYYCEDNSVVVVDLTIMLLDSDAYFTAFSKAWGCQGQGVDGKPKTKLLKLRLPATLVYRPDYFLKADSVWQVSWCKVRAWLIDEATWFSDHSVDVYASSLPLLSEREVKFEVQLTAGVGGYTAYSAIIAQERYERALLSFRPGCMCNHG